MQCSNARLKFAEELAKHDDAVCLLRSGRAMLKLGRVFAQQTLVEIATLSDDLFLDAWLSGATILLGSEDGVGFANQLLVIFCVETFCSIYEVTISIESEYESYAGSIPTVQMRRHAEVGVS